MSRCIRITQLIESMIIHISKYLSIIIIIANFLISFRSFSVIFRIFKIMLSFNQEMLFFVENLTEIDFFQNISPELREMPDIAGSQCISHRYPEILKIMFWEILQNWMETLLIGSLVA